MANKCVKVIPLGDSHAGKTHLLLRYSLGKWPTAEEYHTIYISEYLIKTVHLEGDEGTYELGLFDLNGGEDYHPHLRRIDYHYTDVFLLCFAVDDREMFDNIRDYWVPDIKRYQPGVPFMVVATKTDLRSKNEDHESNDFNGSSDLTIISYEEGVKMAKSVRAAEYVECSSLTGEGVDDVFKAAAKVFARFPRKKPRRKCVLL